jgi:hypothetical protein
VGGAGNARGRRCRSVRRLAALAVIGLAGCALSACSSGTTSAAIPATSEQAASTPGVPRAFPSPVRQALAALAARTSLPLAGPTDLASPDALSALTALERGSWSVQLYACPRPEPLNSPAIGSCEDGADTDGGFGVHEEASAAAARAALPAVASIAGAAQPVQGCPAGSPQTTVDGQTVALCGPSGSPPTTASWTEGDWRIVWLLDGEQGTALTATLAPLVERLDQVFLPPHPGVFGVDEAPDGQHATAAWAVGDTVFWDFSYHSAVQAADMAASTRSFRP